MDLLDENTLNSIAAMICDTDGPHHRQYWQLPKFFRNAGWGDVPEYDESGRMRWTLDQLVARRHATTAIHQVLCRLADPREYPDNPDDAPRIAEQLNRVLAFEGLRLMYKRGRPGVIECEPVFSTPASNAPVALKADLADIVRDPELVTILRARLDEARTCREYGAHLSCVIMLGSILEGVLVHVVRSRPEEVGRRAGITGKREWKLADLIDTAHKCGWIQLDVKRFSHDLRDYRNMVHPLRQLSDDHRPDEDTVAVCWNVVVAALNDLAAVVEVG